MSYTPYPSAIDAAGEVRWLYAGDNGHLLRRLRNGNLMIQQENCIVEIDMLGRRAGRSWEVVPRDLHHDAVEMSDGSFLALSSAEDSFDDEVVMIDQASGTIVGRWDFRQILDPDRPVMPANLNPKDWLHMNGIVHDSGDGSVIVSGRDQSALVKVYLASGRIAWILGNHDKWKAQFEPYLLRPVSELFAPFIGDADYLPNGNRLACFGGITRDLEGRPMELFDFENDKVNMMKVSAHIIELTGETPARVVREVVLADDDASTYEGYRSYRAEKMSLYP